LFFVVVFTLLPLVVYCFVLGLVNRRKHPVIVGGVWDVLGMLFGASGFLLFAGPFILGGVNERWREHWLFNTPGPASDSADAGHELWLWIRVAYVVIVVAWGALLVWRRRHVLAIYNVNPDLVPEVVAERLQSLRIPFRRAGNRFFVAPAPASPANSNGALTADPAYSATAARAVGASPAGALSSETAFDLAATIQPPLSATAVQDTPLLELDLFHSLNHVSLYWAPAARPMQATIEANLRRSVGEIESEDNSASLWFLSIAATLFVVLMAAVIFWVVLTLLYSLRSV